MPKVLVIAATDLAPDLGQTIVWSSDVERLVASTPTSAAEAARSFVPSLVVLESAGGGETLELLRRLRRSAGTRRSSIVVVSRSDAPAQEELLMAGANLVLPTPIDPAASDPRLEKLLSIPLRLKTRFPVHVGPREAEKEPARALDVSRCGMLIEMDPPPAVGSTLELSFTLPGDDVEARARGEVVRVSGGVPTRVGLHLLDLDERTVTGIERLLAETGPERAFGRYEVLGPLAEGSMGRVFRAFDPLAHRVVAIKTLRPELLGGPEAEEYVQRFQREAQAAARLVHPHIITIFDVGEDYFVMELLEGATLQAILRDRGRLPPEEAQQILRPVAEALDYAHALGTIHRDVKPANIMVLADGRPKIMDFGVAHLTSASMTASGQTFGSPAYMAPEQIANSEASVQTDLFSLAVVAYEMLTGHRPFRGERVTPILYNVLNVEPAAASTWVPELPARYDDVLRRALAKDPTVRFQSVGAFVTALTSVDALPAITRSGPVRSRPPAPHDPASATATMEVGSLSPLLWLRLRPGAAVLGLALLVGAGLLFLLNPLVPKPTPILHGLMVSATPTGAKVLVDGVAKGSTPLLLPNLRPGRHKVRVELSHFAPAELSIETSDSGPPVPLQFALQPLSATLEITSEPPGAAVRVDGQRVGNSPVSGFRVPPGTHDVWLEAPGYGPWSRTVQAEAGQSVAIEAALVATGKPQAEQPGPQGRGTLQTLGWVRPGDLLELGPGVTPPRRIAGQPAAYPDAARKPALKGNVTVELTVTETGEVSEPRVVDSAGEMLDNALLQAVRSWRYEPAESNGVKVRVRIRERQVFGPLSE